MRLHGNHRTCPSSRLLMCRRVLEQEWTVLEAAEAAGCSPRTVWKWLARYRAGDVELVDRSSRPKRSPARLSADRVGAIEALRRVWMSAAEISEALKIPLSTVSVWLKRIGLGKRSRLEPTEPIVRYERDTPGELVHVDIKRLSRISARGAGRNAADCFTSTRACVSPCSRSQPAYVSVRRQPGSRSWSASSTMHSTYRPRAALLMIGCPHSRWDRRPSIRCLLRGQRG